MLLEIISTKIKFQIPQNNSLLIKVHYPFMSNQLIKATFV